MASKAPVPKEVRAARSYLRQRGIPTQIIPPRKFAAAAKENDTTFEELLAFIARLFSGGQMQSQRRQEQIESIARGGK